MSKKKKLLNNNLEFINIYYIIPQFPRYIQCLLNIFLLPDQSRRANHIFSMGKSVINIKIMVTKLQQKCNLWYDSGNATFLFENDVHLL